MDTKELNVAGKTDLGFTIYECHAALKLIQLNFRNGKTASSDVAKLRWCSLHVSPCQCTGFIFPNFLKNSLLFGVQLAPVQTVKCFMPPVGISVIVL